MEIDAVLTDSFCQGQRACAGLFQDNNVSRAMMKQITYRMANILADRSISTALPFLIIIMELFYSLHETEKTSF